MTANSTYMLQDQSVGLRLIQQDDAEFILKLRQDNSLNQFLSPTDISVEQQKQWISSYKQREDQQLEYYFIINSILEDRPIGTVRLYSIDYTKKECTFGSFIVHPSRPSGTTFRAMMLSLQKAFDLNLERVILDVRKQNINAISFYEYCGFQQYGETDIDKLYELSKEAYLKLLGRI